MHRLSATEIVNMLRLEPLAGEGGFYRQTWIYTDGEYKHVPVGTAIYYLITLDSWSALHRLVFDEVFHFYLGDPCVMVTVDRAGAFEQVRLGHDLADGERVQHVVPAGSWQGTQLAPGGEWALFGTTMAPGFRPDVFELADSSSLEGYSDDVRRQLEPYLAYTTQEK